MYDNSTNYFIIERLDKDNESDNLKNVYDLSILNKIKEVNINSKNKIKKVKTKKLSQLHKKRFIQIVKKTILSANLTYKWKLEAFKQILLFFHLFIFFSGLASNFKDPNKQSLLSMYLNRMLPAKKIEYNISYNINETINNFTNNTNNTNNYSSNFSDYNQTNDNHETIRRNFDKKLLIFTSLFNQILLIPIWLIFFNKYMPKWKEVNDTLYKITNYLLYCESLSNKNYCFHLMKNYSILVIKKKFYYKYKRLPDELRAQNLLPIDLNKNDNKIKNNIFLYCISIINDFILEDFANINYHQLLPTEDANDINILIKYMESSLHEKLKKFIKKIMMPISFLVFISLYNSKNSSVYHTITSIFLLVNLLIGQYIFKEYYRSYKENIDKFIDNFNLILIAKNRFIFRKDRLIIYFALKNNKYTKTEILNTIKKIIS